MRLDHEKDRALAREIEADQGSLKKESGERARDMEQLKALVTGLDNTRQQLVDRLKGQLAHTRAAEEQVATLETQVLLSSKIYGFLNFDFWISQN